MLFCGHNVTLVPPSLQEIQNSEKHIPSHQKFKFQGCSWPKGASKPGNPLRQKTLGVVRYKSQSNFLACRMINLNVFYFHLYILHFFCKDHRDELCSNHLVVQLTNRNMHLKPGCRKGPARVKYIYIYMLLNIFIW